MTAKNLQESLLQGQSALDAPTLADAVLRRDARHIRTWAVACVVAWMAVVALPWATALPMLAKIAEHQRSGTADARALAQLLGSVRHATLITFLASLASMLVAAISTVTLVVTSRRATLRQVNARLRDLSAQLATISTPSHP